MATVGLEPSRAADMERRFYPVMALVMAGVIVAGFSQTYPRSIATPPPLPLLLHVHAALFASWVLLFVAQPALAAKGSLRLHRRLGWAGAVLAASMVVSGVIAVSLALRDHFVPSFLPPPIFVAANLVLLARFGALVAAGVAQRRRPDWHKRLMLCASVSILAQGLGRILPLSLAGDFAPLVLFGVVNLFALAGPAFDLVVRGRIHPAYYWGVGAVLMEEVATPLVAFSPVTPLLIRLLGG